MKKLIALVLALAMVALCAVASATTITINQNNTNGTAGAESYDLYKIFDVTKSSTDSPVTDDNNIGTAPSDTGFSYTISSSSPWVAKLGSFEGDTWTSAQNQSYVTLTKLPGDTSKYNVVATSGLDTAAEAKNFAAFLLANKGDIDATDTILSNGTTATYTGDDGYYLITSTLGTSLILATSDIEINTKNSYPTTEKEVEESNYRIGEKVKYTITVNLPATVDYTKDVTVHDTMDSVMAVDSTSVHAKVVNNNDFDSHITYVPSTSFAAGHEAHPNSTGKTQYDFVLDIDSLAPSAGETATAKSIIITYEAELLNTAAADTGYINKEFVEYSEYKTPEDDTEIKTFDFELDKTFAGVDDAHQADYEATFALYESNGTTAINLVQGTRYQAYHVPDSTETATTNTFEVKGGDTGVVVKGLDAGTYKIKETATSNGYNVMTDVITVVIDEDGDVTYTIGSGTSAAEPITVTNQSGTVLPSTGGIGTTIFYILGGLLVVGAAVVLVARRKAGQN